MLTNLFQVENVTGLLEQNLNDAINQYDISGDTQVFIQDLVTLSTVAASTNISDVGNTLLSLFIPAAYTTNDTTQYAIEQVTSSFAVLMGNTPIMDYSVVLQAVDYLSTTVNDLGDLLSGSPTEDLVSSISSILSASVDSSGSRKRDDQSLEEVTPTLRYVVGSLATISGSDSICGQTPVEITTQNVQMNVAKGISLK
jgi:hypothetical protein